MPDEIHLTDEAAQRCAAACDAFVEGLAPIISQISNAKLSGGFGTFPSGRAVEAKYDNLLNGPEGSLTDVLTQHARVVENLKQAFLAAGAGYRTTEDDTVAMLNRSAQPR